MQIRFGYDLAYDFSAPTAVVLLLYLRRELTPRLVTPENIWIRSEGTEVQREEFIDAFDNRAIRLTAPAGLLEVSCAATIHDSGRPAPVVAQAREHPVSALPPEVLPFLLPSRYCEVDLLGSLAWSLFGGAPPGWGRVQTVCDWVHQHLTFDYQASRATRTASQAYSERTGVCRDFTHLAITLCRCLNIPARYATGYLGDVGVPFNPDPMDFSAWMEVYLDGQWHIFDVRHNARRIGHLGMAHGRDAADVAFTTTFGPHVLRRFIVKTEEAPSASVAA